MADVRYNKSHHAGPNAEARINNRLKPSAGAGAGDEQITKGSGPTRTTTTVWHGGTARRQGNPAVGSNQKFRGEGQQTSPLNAGRGRDE
jgi:hypothetical protein